MERALTEPVRVRRSAARTPGRGRGLLLLEDIGTLIGQSEDISSTLARIVSLVADQLDMEVCSLYRFESDTNRLNLLATKGLDSISGWLLWKPLSLSPGARSARNPGSANGPAR